MAEDKLFFFPNSNSNQLCWAWPIRTPNYYYYNNYIQLNFWPYRTEKLSVVFGNESSRQNNTGSCNTFKDVKTFTTQLVSLHVKAVTVFCGLNCTLTARQKAYQQPLVSCPPLMSPDIKPLAHTGFFLTFLVKQASFYYCALMRQQKQEQCLLNING